MFQELQHYFLQYKTVGIPGVGTLHLVQQPATLDVANKTVQAPRQQVRFSRQASIDDHQLRVLAYAFNNDRELVAEELTRFGEALRSHLQEQPFCWQGIGRLELEGAYVHFEPHHETLLAPVAAERVLREHVQHTVLVGDTERQLTTEGYQSDLELERPRRSWLVLVGWIIALLAVVFIAYHIYRANGDPGASGLQSKPSVKETPLQHD